MPGTYKVTGIDPGPTAFQLGNCLTIRKSRDVVNTPGMYANVRGLAMGWMNSGDVPCAVETQQRLGSRLRDHR